MLSAMTTSGLLQDQIALAGDARVILDVGAHDGATTLEYLEAFPRAQVHAFEPQSDNAAAARGALGTHPRCTLHNLAVCGATGTVVLHVNSHSETHSLLPIGRVDLWDSPQHEIGAERVAGVALDDFTAQHGIDAIDILGMDIQGGELAALYGAAGLLKRKAIKVLRLEVEFAPLYAGQPLFWEIGAYLARYDYGFYGLYEMVRRPDKAVWADALFIA